MQYADRRSPSPMHTGTLEKNQRVAGLFWVGIELSSSGERIGAKKYVSREVVGDHCRPRTFATPEESLHCVADLLDGVIRRTKE
ncbi:hypothetical protein EVAR_81410_1 [Eumeta japonica]|uniref:Uncharacterized protein n=1 Tax=Eumeta variegata TaxID=151549 RepID=A0A4C1WG22_EUMVA|nr:hypothetical protein EVAR_81410_1 [Eumeta japonica]